MRSPPGGKKVKRERGGRAKEKINQIKEGRGHGRNGCRAGLSRLYSNQQVQ
jgi:hypothetical protein